ncbi:aromatic acid exporter family protein [Paenibacillus fonticola]|uniref:aromatic acid exporter family protein n=1 Tax=Paenibacillus fonticola TaxID=379896 RepID=UPI000379EB71|nr:aromatic acid exporter family protein [Paenibacillus fonticola]
MTSKWIDFIKYNGMVWKPPLAAALSWAFAEWAGSKHPYLAPLTVILSIQLTVDKSVQFAWQRVIGTVAGVLFTAAIAPYVGLNAWSIGLLLLVGAFIVTWLKLEYALLIQIALSILLVLYFHNKMPSYPLDRIRDTVIGAIVALLIQVFIFPPDSVNKAQTRMNQFADHLSYHFMNTALWVKTGSPSSEANTLHSELQNLFQELHQTTSELKKAEQSLRFNPLGRKKRLILKKLNRQMDQLRSGFANLADMIRIFTSWSESGKFATEDQHIWAEHLNALAKLISEWRSTLDDSAACSLVSNDPALQIQTPAHMENYQYPLALYTNAEQVVQDFRIAAAFSNKAR